MQDCIIVIFSLRSPLILAWCEIYFIVIEVLAQKILVPKMFSPSGFTALFTKKGFFMRKLSEAQYRCRTFQEPNLIRIWTDPN